MESVLDREILEIAEPGVDAAQGVVRIVVGPHARFARQSGLLGMLQDQPREPLAPAPIEPVRLGVFVDQPLELARVAGQAAVDERRRQVADGHRGDPALGLRRFSGIADDEGIDHRQGADDQFGKAGAGQRHGLAGQPFERAMGAHVDERIGLGDVPKPKPEREQRVPRRQGRIVVVRSAIARTSAVRRKCHQHVAECARAEPERTVTHVGVVLGTTPYVVHPLDRVGRQRRRQFAVELEREHCIIGRDGELVEQRPRAWRRIGNVVTRRLQSRPADAITLAGTSSPTA